MESYLERVLLTAAISLALVLPFVVLAFIVSRKGKAALNAVLLFATFMLLDNACIWLFKLVDFIPAWGHWNWQGKILEALLPILLALLAPAAFPPKEVGITLPEPKRSGRTLLITCALYALIFIAVMLMMGSHFGIKGDLPTFAYEATMPGLGEEIMYRGLMLMVLNEAFGRPWKFAGIQFGWGFVIVTAMFGFIHGVEVQPGASLVVHLHWDDMIFPAAIGAVLAWLRERTGSVWPCVLFHNFVNVLNHLMV